MRSRALIALFAICVSHVAGRPLPASGVTATGIDCGKRVIVSATNDGGTLQLSPTDPIFSHACPAGGLLIVNAGTNAVNQSYTVACPANTIQGMGRGNGITLIGPNLTVTGCNVDGFRKGIVARGDNILIQNSVAAHCVRDGIVMADYVSPLNPNFQGSFLDTSSALSNGGWGIKISGHKIDTTPSGTFGSTVSGNALGGLWATGLLHNITTVIATANTGPGFKVTSGNCCGFNTLTTVQALGNIGPGVIFVGRDDGLNSAPLGVNNAVLFFPETLDVSGTIMSTANGACAAKALPAPTLLSQQICAFVQGIRCSAAVLARCSF